MEIIATQRNIRQAPRKVRLVANAVKDLPLEQAFRQLSVIQRAATIPVLKTLRQAVANATHNFHLKPEDLVIKSIVVDEGTMYKRFRAVSRGRAHRILKRTSHVMVKLTTIEPVATPSVAPQTGTLKSAPASLKQPATSAAASSSVKSTAAATSTKKQEKNKV